MHKLDKNIRINITLINVRDCFNLFTLQKRTLIEGLLRTASGLFAWREIY